MSRLINHILANKPKAHNSRFRYSSIPSASSSSNPTLVKKSKSKHYSILAESHSVDKNAKNTLQNSNMQPGILNVSGNQRIVEKNGIKKNYELKSDSKSLGKPPINSSSNSDTLHCTANNEPNRKRNDSVMAQSNSTSQTISSFDSSKKICIESNVQIKTLSEDNANIKSNSDGTKDSVDATYYVSAEKRAALNLNLLIKSFSFAQLENTNTIPSNHNNHVHPSRNSNTIKGKGSNFDHLASNSDTYNPMTLVDGFPNNCIISDTINSVESRHALVSFIECIKLDKEISLLRSTFQESLSAIDLNRLLFLAYIRCNGTESAFGLFNSLDPFEKDAELVRIMLKALANSVQLQPTTKPHPDDEMVMDRLFSVFDGFKSSLQNGIFDVLLV